MPSALSLAAGFPIQEELKVALLGKVGNSVAQLEATQFPRESYHGNAELQKHVTCIDRQPSLYARHVAPAPQAVEIHQSSMWGRKTSKESGISTVSLTGAANKAVSPEPLIMEQTWSLKAKGKLQMCGHLWLPGTCPGVFWLWRQHRELTGIACPPPVSRCSNLRSQ